jgi:hypothetical protein
MQDCEHYTRFLNAVDELFVPMLGIQESTRNTVLSVRPIAAQLIKTFNFSSKSKVFTARH